MRRTAAGVLFVLVAWNLWAQPGAPRGWQNLSRLAAGQPIEIANKKGQSWKGALAGVSEDSIRVTRKGQTVAVPRAEVSRVRLRPAKGLRDTMIGMGIGAGAGLGLGFAAGEGLAERSGGDFRNLKPAIVAITCGVGALVGALVGSLVGERHTTIYQAK